MYLFYVWFTVLTLITLSYIVELSVIGKLVKQPPVLYLNHSFSIKNTLNFNTITCLLSLSYVLYPTKILDYCMNKNSFLLFPMQVLLFPIQVLLFIVLPQTTHFSVTLVGPLIQNQQSYSQIQKLLMSIIYISHCRVFVSCNISFFL